MFGSNKRAYFYKSFFISYYISYKDKIIILKIIIVNIKLL